MVVLGAAGVAAAFASDWFVTALTPATEALHMSQDFAGLVVVAIAGIDDITIDRVVWLFALTISVVTALVTERGVARPVNPTSVASLLRS